MGLRDLFKKRRGDADGPPPAELALLVERLAHADWKVRFEACVALRALGPRALAAAPRLHELTNDDNGDVCNAAAAALSEIERDSP